MPPLSEVYYGICGNATPWKITPCGPLEKGSELLGNIVGFLTTVTFAGLLPLSPNVFGLPNPKGWRGVCRSWQTA